MKKKTMDLILVLVGISVVVFTIVMIWLYLLTGAIPDTLCTCFFVACQKQRELMEKEMEVRRLYDGTTSDQQGS